MKQTSSSRPFSWWRVFYFCLGLGVLYFLLRQIDFGDLVGLILQIQPQFLLLGGVIYFAKGVIRSLRLAQLNANLSMRFWKVLRLTFASSLASQLLPMKLGEFSYVYLLKKEKDASLSQGFSSLMVLRLIDLLAISLLFVGIGLAVHLADALQVYFRSILVFMGLLLAGLVGLLVVAGRDETILLFLKRQRLVGRFALFQRLVDALGSFLAALKRYRPAIYLEGIALAALEWLINYAVFYVILLGVGMAPTWFEVVVSVTFAALASVLPINSFGNFGTQEAGWATGLLLLGYSKEAAIISGFATHLLTLGYMLLLGGLGWLSYFFVKRWQKPAFYKK